MLKAEVPNLYRARATEREYFLARATLETLYWAGGHSIRTLYWAGGHSISIFK